MKRSLIFARAVSLLLLVAGAASLSGCKKGTTPASTMADARRDIHAPDFTLKDLSDTPVSLSDYKGQVVMIDFWATWCAPCRESIPALDRVYKDYKDKGLQILGISLDEDVKAVKSFVKDYGMEYPVLLGENHKVTADYRIQGVPTFYLIDQEGKVVNYWSGFGAPLEDEWRQKIGELLASS